MFILKFGKQKERDSFFFLNVKHDFLLWKSQQH